MKNTKKIKQMDSAIIDRTKKYTWKNTICAPYVKKKPRDYSCFSLAGLRKIAFAWNKKNPTNGIKYENMDRETLWKEIKYRFDGKCYNEVCWVNQPDIKEVYNPLRNEDLDVFRPVKPQAWDRDHDKWLSSVDIKEVMEQYMEAYRNFVFIGPVPIDFDDVDSYGNCISAELCKINLKALMNRKIWYIGIIFNLDEHDEPGSHWVALYCNMNAADGALCEISYWDSVAMPPTEEIRILIKRLQTQSVELNKKVKININKIQHQYKNTECGVYCLNFIIQMLRGESFKKVITNIIDDDNMNKRRDLFFSNPRLRPEQRK